ncbi:MAG TPA: outer membrane lipoprotein-sorting protein [Nevskiaceae bacterium]|nr:outer membrane lipoprotein-sorting protein [Nevskiaceae bacterium]
MKRIATLLALVIIAPARAQDAQHVIDCMRANVPPALRVQEIELAATDRTGTTRSLKGKLYAMLEKTSAGGGLVRAMLRMESPEAVAGTAYLVRESADSANENMFVYLPAFRRVRRVTSSLGDRSLLGTDFSFSDFKLLSNSFVGSSAKIEPSGVVVQRPTYTIRFTPLAGAASPYSQVRAWVDQETCVPLKADFYIGSAVRKRLTAPASALQRVGDFWYLSEVVMRDLLEGTTTVLRTGKLTGAKELPGRYFDPNLFYVNE